MSYSKRALLAELQAVEYQKQRDARDNELRHLRAALRRIEQIAAGEIELDDHESVLDAIEAIAHEAQRERER